MEPAGRRSALCPLTGVGSASLPAPVKGKTSRVDEAANSGRQLSYAEMDAAYAGVVVGRPVKGANAGVDSSAPRQRAVLKTVILFLAEYECAA
jgi:hypothetical protein